MTADVRCPNCGSEMREHDIGYDECEKCDFFAIYDDGQEAPWICGDFDAVTSVFR